MSKIYRAIGLMSGTSMDGIDLGLIESDGQKTIKPQNFYYKSYNDAFKKRLKNIIYNKPSLFEIKSVENELTILHGEIVNEFLEKNKISASEIDLIGFHGHTIYHNPEQLITWQIGNSCLLEKMTNIRVISNFRTKDVANGGQGAPLVPIYHFNLLEKDNKPRAVLNIGGISNITFFENNNVNSIEAFDICFGNAPIDDLVKNKLNLDFDKDGKLAKSGKIDEELSRKILSNKIFQKKPPKSFDRNDFKEILEPVTKLKLEDALATLCHIHAMAIKINLDLLNKYPEEILVCGGGRKNISILENMQKNMPDISIKSIDDIGLNGDSIECDAFAYLAIRKLLNLPISFKNTTGVEF